MNLNFLAVPSRQVNSSGRGLAQRGARCPALARDSDDGRRRGPTHPSVRPPTAGYCRPAGSHVPCDVPTTRSRRRPRRPEHLPFCAQMVAARCFKPSFCSSFPRASHRPAYAPPPSKLLGLVLGVRGWSSFSSESSSPASLPYSGNTLWASTCWDLSSFELRWVVSAFLVAVMWSFLSSLSILGRLTVRSCLI